MNNCFITLNHLLVYCPFPSAGSTPTFSLMAFVQITASQTAVPPAASPFTPHMQARCSQG